MMLLFTAMLLALPSLSLQQSLSDIEGCLCLPGCDVAQCDASSVTSFPQISPRTRQLDLSFNRFSNPILEKQNFTDYVHLEHLSLKGCGITGINYHTFTDMTKLTMLDLSSNSIAIISTGALVGLRLDYLYLEENPYLKVTSSSFNGMSTELLNLGKCQIEHLTASIFRPLMRNNKLRKIFLQENKIERFDRSMLEVFRSVEAVRIHGNPLVCDCQSRWLKEFYDLNADTKVIRDTYLEPRCDGPDHVTGQYFNRLSLADFSCDTPTLQADISFSQYKGTLACISRGTPLPTVSWYRPNGVVVELEPQGHQDSIRNEIELLADEPGTLGQYRCVASNDGGNISLSVNVDWPFEPSPGDKGNGDPSKSVDCNPTTTSKDVILTNPPSDTDAQTHYLKIKYFTLVDMVAAILGTFVSTLIITIVTLHFCVYRRKKSTQYATPVMSEYSSGSSNGSDKNGPYPVSLHSLHSSQLQAQRPLPSAPNKTYHKIYDENHYMATNIEERDEFLRFAAQQAANGRVTPASSSCDTCPACRTMPHSQLS